MQPSVSLALSAVALASASQDRPKSRLILRVPGDRPHAPLQEHSPGGTSDGPESVELVAAGEAGQTHFLLEAPPVPGRTAHWSRLKIITGGDASSVAAARKAIENQQAFAQLHGYAYEVHEGNFAYPWIAYWHKIDALLRELQQPNPSEVLVWMDLDILVTNPPQKMLEWILDAYPSKAVLLTEDAQRNGPVPGAARAKRLVNTGVILVRSGPRAVRVLERLFDYGRYHRDAAYLPQDMDTLHEQDAVNWLLGGPRRHVWGRHIAVIPQRRGGLNLNTFARNLYDPMFKDPASSEWSVDDFTVHCTGLRSQLREWCIEDSVVAAERALYAEAARRNTTAPCSSTLHHAVQALL